MNATSKRTVDPYRIDFSVMLDDADVAAAFFDQLDPDEDLFYEVFSQAWMKLAISEQLAALSKVAQLVESAATAQSLNLAAGPPQPKG